MKHSDFVSAIHFWLHTRIYFFSLPHVCRKEETMSYFYFFSFFILSPLIEVLKELQLTTSIPNEIRIIYLFCMLHLYNNKDCPVPWNK